MEDVDEDMIAKHIRSMKKLADADELITETE